MDSLFKPCSISILLYFSVTEEEKAELAKRKERAINDIIIFISFICFSFQYLNGTGPNSSEIDITLQQKGEYTIQLISGNSYGSDTTVKINIISAGGIETPATEEFFQAIPNRWTISNPDFDKSWGIAPIGSTTDRSTDTVELDAAIVSVGCSRHQIGGTG